MVGIPARTVDEHRQRDAVLDHANIPDPISDTIWRFQEKLSEHKRRLSDLEDATKKALESVWETIRDEQVSDGSHI